MDVCVFENIDFYGGFVVSYLVEDKFEILLIKEELVSRVVVVNYFNFEDYNWVLIILMDLVELYVGMIMDQNDLVGVLWIVCLLFGVLLFFFVLLFIFNFINMNLSCIMECEVEIGVWKVFGVYLGIIFYQFVFENVIIIFIGGIIGMILVMLVFFLINDSQVLL